MTHTIAYDSFEDSELLKKAGYNETQIKIEILRTKKQNEEFNKIIDNNLATKTDIFLIQRDIAELRKDTKHEFESVRQDIAELRKDTKHEFESVRQDIAELRKDTKTDIALVQKDIKALEASFKKDIMWIKIIGAAFGSTILGALGILLSR